MQPRLMNSLKPSCLSLLRVGITGPCHLGWFEIPNRFITKCVLPALTPPGKPPLEDTKDTDPFRKAGLLVGLLTPPLRPPRPLSTRGPRPRPPTTQGQEGSQERKTRRKKAKLHVYKSFVSRAPPSPQHSAVTLKSRAGENRRGLARPGNPTFPRDLLSQRAADSTGPQVSRKAPQGGREGQGRLPLRQASLPLPLWPCARLGFPWGGRPPLSLPFSVSPSLSGRAHCVPASRDPGAQTLSPGSMRTPLGKTRAGTTPFPVPPTLRPHGGCLSPPYFLVPYGGPKPGPPHCAPSPALS